MIPKGDQKDILLTNIQLSQQLCYDMVETSESYVHVGNGSTRHDKPKSSEERALRMISRPQAIIWIDSIPQGSSTRSAGYYLYRGPFVLSIIQFVQRLLGRRFGLNNFHEALPICSNISVGKASTAFRALINTQFIETIWLVGLCIQCHALLKLPEHS